MTNQEIENNYQSMFGLSVDQMNSAYKVRYDKELNEIVTGSFDTSYDMFAMQILSDAQELQERGAYEDARQLMNRAKYVLAEGRKLYRKHIAK